MSEQLHLDAFEPDHNDQGTIEEAVEEYLDYREETSLKDTTIATEQRQLGHLEDYCQEKDIETTDELLSHDLDRYRKWRRFEAPTEVEELAESTITAHMITVDRFVDHVEEKDE